MQKDHISYCCEFCFITPLASSEKLIWKTISGNAPHTGIIPRIVKAFRFFSYACCHKVSHTEWLKSKTLLSHNAGWQWSKVKLWAALILSEAPGVTFYLCLSWPQVMASNLWHFLASILGLLDLCLHNVCHFSCCLFASNILFTERSLLQWLASILSPNIISF